MTKKDIGKWSDKYLGRRPVIDRTRGRWRLRCTLLRRERVGDDKGVRVRSLVVRLEARGSTRASAHAALVEGCRKNPVALRRPLPRVGA